jgi:hypothetical protein
MTKFVHTATGLLGIGGVELTDSLLQVTPTNVGEAGKLLLQLVIGGVTLWRLFKKPRSKKG